MLVGVGDVAIVLAAFSDAGCVVTGGTAPGMNWWFLVTLGDLFVALRKADRLLGL